MITLDYLKHVHELGYWLRFYKGGKVLDHTYVMDAGLNCWRIAAAYTSVRYYATC